MDLRHSILPPAVVGHHREGQFRPSQEGSLYLGFQAPVYSWELTHWLAPPLSREADAALIGHFGHGASPGTLLVAMRITHSWGQFLISQPRRPGQPKTVQVFPLGIFPVSVYFSHGTERHRLFSPVKPWMCQD